MHRHAKQVAQKEDTYVEQNLEVASPELSATKRVEKYLSVINRLQISRLVD